MRHPTLEEARAVWRLQQEAQTLAARADLMLAELGAACEAIPSVKLKLLAGKAIWIDDKGEEVVIPSAPKQETP